MNEHVVLVGGGGHCRAVADVIAAQGRYEIAGVVEKDGRTNPRAAGFKVIGTDGDLPRLAAEYESFVITLGKTGSDRRRELLYDRLKALGANMPVIVSPHAFISRTSTLAEGVVVMHGAIINSGVRVGCNCIINTGAILEHDVEVGDHCHIAPRAVVNGGCRIGNNVFTGSGAVVVHGADIADNVVIGAGCVVTGSIGEAGTYAGVPARRLMTNV